MFTILQCTFRIKIRRARDTECGASFYASIDSLSKCILFAKLLCIYMHLMSTLSWLSNPTNLQQEYFFFLKSQLGSMANRNLGRLLMMPLFLFATFITYASACMCPG